MIYICEVRSGKGWHQHIVTESPTSARLFIGNLENNAQKTLGIIHQMNHGDVLESTLFTESLNGETVSTRRIRASAKKEIHER